VVNSLTFPKERVLLSERLPSALLQGLAFTTPDEAVEAVQRVLAA
jgi:hypothetical protein